MAGELAKREKSLEEEVLDESLTVAMMLTIMVVVVASVLQQLPGQTQAAAQSIQVQGAVDHYYLDAASSIRELTFEHPLVSLTIENLGTARLYVKTNTLNSKAMPVEPGRIANIEKGETWFYRLFYYTESGITQCVVMGIF